MTCSKISKHHTFSPPTCNGERSTFCLSSACLAARQKQFGKEVSKTLGNLRSLDLTSYKHLTEFLNLLKAD
ncbi:hypothetical protein Bca4012_028153 [Brassica carinata]